MDARRAARPRSSAMDQVPARGAWWRWSVAALTVLIAAPVAAADSAEATGGMAATVHPLATQAAVATMKAGGNAVDAAVAAGLMLGVVNPHNSGLGGGCFILIRLSNGQFVAIDGRETAPARAHPKMFWRDGKPDSNLSQTGPLAVGVPGALAAYHRAVTRYGKLGLAPSLRRAATVARQGFAVDRSFAARLAATAPLIRKFPETARVYLKPDGQPYAEGERFRNPDLADTYLSIAEHGIEWFYRGPFAQRVGHWMAEHDGLLTSEDFAKYAAKDRRPIRTRYRQYEIVGFPPPSSGGVHVAEILHILEPYDLRALYNRDATTMRHVVIEAMKLAFADRAYWLGDPDYAAVPRGLIDPSYGRQLAARIRLDRASVVEGHGMPPGAARDHFGRHTTHLTVADASGMWVAITQTINTSYGSKVLVPKTGLVLNNEMDDFSIAPGVPNAFGLIGAKANEVEPGKRPLSSMSPTIVQYRNEPILTVGAAGGPKIITQVVLTLIRTLDLKLSLPDAVAAPRFHHQWRPDVVMIERDLEPMADRLKALGHEVRVISSAGVTQAIARMKRPNGQSVFVGVADPRVPGSAQGWEPAAVSR